MTPTPPILARSGRAEGRLFRAATQRACLPIATLVASILLLHASCFACLKIQHTIILNADGSGQLIEKVWVADWIIQSAKSNPDLSAIPDLLQEKNVRDRLPDYGKVSFVSHETIDRGSHGIESTTVMSFANISNLTLPCILSSDSSHPATISFALSDKQQRNDTTFTGWNFSVTQGLRISQSARSAPAQGSMSPAEKEKWMRLLPILRAMADGLEISAKIQAFGPIDGRPTHTLYEMTDKDLDADALIDLVAFGRKPPGADLRRDNYSVQIEGSITPQTPSK